MNQGKFLGMVSNLPAPIISGQAGLPDLDSVAAVCEKYSPDVVIHCAGIAHQKIGAVDSATYIRVNSDD